MLAVHEEPKEVQKELRGMMERSEFCGTPTRYWTADAQHTVCPQCVETHAVSDLKQH